ncbi:MAG: hypothetical protein K2I64_01805 [Muribaculaceae bacterium]|nr:hypothetical protein [Muribaculaceae bacterium]
MDSFIEEIHKSDRLTDVQYMQIIEGLELIAETVCDKAKHIIDSGFTRKDVRQRLSLDTSYISLSEKANILDSTVLEYINSYGYNIEIREKYKEVLKKISRKAEKLGL